MLKLEKDLKSLEAIFFCLRESVFAKEEKRARSCRVNNILIFVLNSRARDKTFKHLVLGK